MTDRPILFSAPMIEAMLSGRKRQTRRVFATARTFAMPERPPVTLRGEDMKRALQGASDFRKIDGDGWIWDCDAFEWQAPVERTQILAHIGYAVGDRLWVREAWRTHRAYDDLKPSELGGEETVWPELGRDNCDAHGRYRHGRFMPRWASRLTLSVTDVRIERLQDCSRADAIAEGIEARGAGTLWGWIDYLEPNPNVTRHFADPRRSYASLWDSINGEGSWHHNPWVVAVTFDVMKGNIDNLSKVAA